MTDPGDPAPFDEPCPACGVPMLPAELPSGEMVTRYRNCGLVQL